MASEEIWKDRFAFSSLLESYEKGLGKRLTPTLREKLKVAGLDLEKLPPAIPAQEMPKYMDIIVAEVWPDTPREQALRELGLCVIRGWQQGLLGAAAAQMLRLIGVQRTLTRLDRAISTTNNFNKTSTVFVNSNEALITVNEVQNMPSYWRGILEAGLEILAVEGEIALESFHPPQATFRAKWK
jgi:uncharacterized protein (TIGR02265 family)